MFIIPIGTKSTMALKPKLTIALIAANILVSIITIPLMLQTESDLFKVQRVRLARQIELYVKEKPAATILGAPSQSAVNGAVGQIEEAKDFRSFQMALYTTLCALGISPQEYQSYEKTLRVRNESFYRATGGEAEELFGEWKRLVAKEAKITDGSVLNRFGLIASRMDRLHTFFTHMFLHAGIWHLLGNMLFLWVVGGLLEDTWGRLPFFIFYVMGGIIAGLAHSLQDTSSTMPLVGASGAIAAAMGAFTVRHFFTKIKLWYFFMFFIRPYWGTFYVPAFVFLPLWFIEQVGFHYISTYVGATGVAYMAHIAGFATGLFVALAIKATGFETRFLAPRVEKTQVEAGVLRDPRFNRACEELDAGRVDSARSAFEALIAERPDDVELIQDVAMLYREKGLAAEQAALADRALKLLIIKGKLEEASRLALEAAGVRNGTPLNCQSMMRVAKWLGEQGRHGEAHDVYRSIIADNPPAAISAKARIALARLLSEKMNGAVQALRLLEEAHRVQLDPEWESAISALETEIKGKLFSHQN